MQIIRLTGSEQFVLVTTDQCY